MGREIYFEIEFDYNTLETGIVLPAELKFGEETSDVRAKLDTGAAFCVFERKHGERIGLDIESGAPLRMITATGKFDTFGHTNSFGSRHRNRNYGLFRGGGKFLPEHIRQTRLAQPREIGFD